MRGCSSGGRWTAGQKYVVYDWDDVVHTLCITTSLWVLVQARREAREDCRQRPRKQVGGWGLTLKTDYSFSSLGLLPEASSGQSRKR